MVDALHSPKGQVLVGCIKDGADASSKTTNNDEECQFPDGKVRGLSAATRAQNDQLDNNRMIISEDLRQ
jgi:hypothetical protein